MNEKHGAIWVDHDNDDSACIVSETHSEGADKLFLIYQRRDGLFMPYSYVKQSSPQWSMPFWTNENAKTVFQTLAEAREFLANYGAAT